MAESSCVSEGTVEVLIEPQLPQPLLAVVGDSPAAVTLRDLAGAIGWTVTTDLSAGAEAVVVATRAAATPMRSTRRSRHRRATSGSLRAPSARGSSAPPCASVGSTRRR